MAYVENNAYETPENTDRVYDMWARCFTQLFSYDEQYPSMPTDRMKLQDRYKSLLDAVYQHSILPNARRVCGLISHS